MDAVLALKLFTALGCGLMAGVFFAFSSFIMNALARLTPAQGISAMQAINITVVNPVFMLVFMGTALACIVLAVLSFTRLQQPGMVYVLAGCLLYILGTMLVTIAFNVPLNDALAKADPHSGEAAKLWANYLSAWTTWNTVRGIAAFLASAMLIVGLRAGA